MTHPYEALSDGSAVWINSPQACVARFCRSSAEYMLGDSLRAAQVLETGTTVEDWDVFWRNIKDIYGVDVQPLAPKFLEAA